jgi:hypothetical protein
MSLFRFRREQMSKVRCITQLVQTRGVGRQVRVPIYVKRALAKYVSLAHSFILLRSEIGVAFSEAFTWVDDFLT